MKKIIFTDLDGTFLDSDTYSYENANNALNLIKKLKIPLIFCTSKTRAEIEFWREKVDIRDPFISENGGGIFIPKDYFSFLFKFDKDYKNYFVIKIGENYNYLRNFISFLKEKYDLQSFSDMAVKEIAKDAGLELSQAKTLVTHANQENAYFLGYQIAVQYNDTWRDSRGQRNANGEISLGLISLRPPQKTLV